MLDNAGGLLVAGDALTGEHPHQDVIDRGITPRYEGYAIEDGFYAVYLRSIRTGAPKFAGVGEAAKKVRTGRKMVYWPRGRELPVAGALVLGPAFKETCSQGHEIDVSRQQIRDAVSEPHRPRHLHL